MRIGSLFSGYGGLEMAVEQVFGATTAWVSDVDKGACKILAHRYPDVPNLGDITSIDWATVEPVDIITGGSPCQDLSHAGKRAGMTAGTRSNLWVAMREAIAQLKPSIVVWENVRGAYSATADSSLEHCQGCMGDSADRGPVLRALGRVLGDLSDLGYDTQWHGLRAADVGAPHARFRVFVVAHRQGIEQRESHVGSVRNESWASTGGHSALSIEHLLPTPTGSDTNGAGQHGNGGIDLRTAVTLLPTTTTQDAANNGGPSQFGRNTRPLNTEVLLLPTPAVNDMGKASRWGDYAAAIARWESVIRRPAPAPTEPTGRDGAHRLSPKFTEWMMGLPEGWITDVPGITRNEALKACGNGVVPQQAYAAISHMVERGKRMAEVLA